jgi:hypothetical protein
VPNGDDQNVYIVMDDFGRNGRAYRETDVERTDLEAVIMDMFEGQYQNPVRVVGFNTAEGWSHRQISSKSCDAAAICKCGKYRTTFNSLSGDTTASTGS